MKKLVIGLIAAVVALGVGAGVFYAWKTGKLKTGADVPVTACGGGGLWTNEEFQYPLTAYPPEVKIPTAVGSQNVYLNFKNTRKIADDVFSKDTFYLEVTSKEFHPVDKIYLATDVKPGEEGKALYEIFAYNRATLQPVAAGTYDASLIICFRGKAHPSRVPLKVIVEEPGRVAVQEGMEFSAWAKWLDGDQPPSLRVYNYATKQYQELTPEQSPAKKGEWVQLSLKFPTPAENDELEVILQCARNYGTCKSVWDNVILTQTVGGVGTNLLVERNGGFEDADHLKYWHKWDYDNGNFEVQAQNDVVQNPPGWALLMTDTDPGQTIASYSQKLSIAQGKQTVEARGYAFEVVGATPAPRLSPGGSSLVQLRLKNTGTATWNRLASQGQFVRLSYAETFANDFCVGPGAESRGWQDNCLSVYLDQDMVKPGETGTFTFLATVPKDAQANTYTRHFKFRVGDGETYVNNPAKEDGRISWSVEVY